MKPEKGEIMLHVLYKNDYEEEKEYLKSAVLIKRYSSEKQSNPENGDGVFTCPHCGKVTEFRFGSFQKNESSWERIYVHLCSSCGKCFTPYETDATEEIPYFPALNLNTYPCDFNEFKTSEQVLYDDENGKLWIYASFVNVFLTNGHVSYEPFYYKFVVNLKKHTSFCYGPVTFSRKKAFGVSGTTMRNCTYARYYIPADVFSDKGIDIMLEQFLEIKQFPSEIVCNCKEDKYSQNGKSDIVAFMAIMNSCPNLIYRHFSINNQYLLSDNDFVCRGAYSNYRQFNYYDSSLFKELPRTLVDTEVLVRRLVKKHGIPYTKAFKKLYLSDIKWLARCVYFKKLGFRNNDILMSLLKMEILGYGDLEGFDIFVKHMVKHCGEHVASRKLLKYLSPDGKYRSDRTTLRDTHKMYKIIYKYDKSLISVVDWGRSIRQIHDLLSKIYTKIEFENKEIPYSKTDMELQGNFQNCDFELPKNTNRLIEVGSLLGTCVGSYRDGVLSKKSLIILMLNKEKVVGCIELVKGRKLNQLSAKYNNPVSIEYKPAFDAWAQQNKIQNLSGCRGYVDFGKDLKLTHDWHTHELDENGDVIRTPIHYEELPF